MLRASHNLLEVFSPADLLAPQNSPKFEIKLTFACFINSSDKFPKSVETTSDVTKVLAKSSRYDFKNPFDYFTMGNIFVGYQPIPSRLWVKPRIHFWDIASGMKIHDDAVPRVCSYCLVMKGDTTKPLILVYAFKSSTFKSRSIKFSQIYLYNIKIMKYTGFHGNVQAKVLWWGMSNDILVTRQERSFNFFNTKSGEFLSGIDMDLKMNVFDSDLRNSQFILNGQMLYASKYYLKSINMESQENILCIDLNYIIYSLYNIRGRFMIVSSKSSSEVWEIESKEIIFKLPYLFIADFKIKTDACPIRLVAQSQNEVSVINFW
ncbi:uncharacterized protein LOC128982770 [Macrosteles quadrilineatus]|uniref:uncharacterized protein LOC128982770 n=1 Tax=Macrosteles quadrilineatus TaxID=74068 RepID=UPI0023E0C6F3|nr:uncharacterized protein LOC128982770 [Macrosteles quadrilineatus]